MVPPFQGMPPYGMPPQQMMPSPFTLAMGPTASVARPAPPSQSTQMLMAMGAKTSDIEKMTTAFVSGIATTVTDDFVGELLKICGKVKSWKRVKDQKGPKGFGFCDFEDADGVLRALRLLNGIKLGDKTLLVKVDDNTRKYLDKFETERTSQVVCVFLPAFSKGRGKKKQKKTQDYAQTDLVARELLSEFLEQNGAKQDVGTLTVAPSSSAGSTFYVPSGIRTGENSDLDQSRAATDLTKKIVRQTVFFCQDPNASRFFQALSQEINKFRQTASTSGARNEKGAEEEVYACCTIKSTTV